MKKTIILALTILLGAASSAQTQPDAEYNLIRRAYKANADGSMDITFRKEIRLLRNRAITAYADKGETFITYNPAFETLTINECYTLRADGSRVETPKNAFVQQLPSECQDCGRYNGIREMAIVHTGLEYGCTIVLDYTLHRASQNYYETIDIRQDCPVKRYELILPDGTQKVFTDLPQTVNEPYMVSDRQTETVTLGTCPSYTAESGLPEAATLLNSLKQDDPLRYAEAIRNWVRDYVTVTPFDLSHVDYRMVPAAQVFASNCGTPLDNVGLLAALYNQAGFQAKIVKNGSGFSANSLSIRLTIDDQEYSVTPTQQGTITNKPAAMTVSTDLDCNPYTPAFDTLVDGFLRFTIPLGDNLLKIDPARLTPTRTSSVQARKIHESYRYVVKLPRGIHLVGAKQHATEVNTPAGHARCAYELKGRKLTITRSLDINEEVITPDLYEAFRSVLIAWHSGRELLFSTKR